MSPTRNPQLTGIAERLAYGIIFWVLMRLQASLGLDPQMVEYLALGIVSGGGAIYAWWLNRPQNIIATAAQIPNPAAADGRTVIVTSPALANATPTLAQADNVVSSADAKIVPK